MNRAAALSVSELNEYARRLLAGDPLLRNLEVSGEISGYKHHYSGHRYFSLKDEGARVQCVMFRQQAVGLDFQPADGMRVIVRASASIYPRDGSYQLYVNAIQKAGTGDLYAQFERLKQKLMAEGLFDPARKRPIPTLPRRIGVVTSETGAAIQDILQIARRRNPNVGILIAPCAVQGVGAAEEIVSAIDRLNEKGECDVLLVGRGGGSIEDLWAFNEEPVARAIAASRTPVISCVGHEIDFTIADFVADLRAPTPSAAAELAVPELKALQAGLDAVLARLASALEAGQKVRRLRLERLCDASPFRYPDRTLLEPRRSALAKLEAGLAAGLAARIEREYHRLNALDATLRALNPAAVLDRGYAIVLKDDAVLDRAANAAAGDTVRMRLRDGELDARVSQVRIKDDSK